jgi:hypothetical protein
MMPWLMMSALVVAAADGEKPELDLKADKDKDTATATVEKDRLIVLLGSETGIGGVTLAPKQGRWPAEVVFRLRYRSGRGFTNLEGLEIRTSRFEVEGSLRTSGEMRFVLADPQGNVPAPKRDADGTLHIKAEVQKDFLEITLPRHMLTGTESVRFNWIDAYRR